MCIKNLTNSHIPGTEFGLPIVQDSIIMIHQVKIEKIIAGGYGLGRLPDGRIILSRHVLPGEKIRAREINRRKGYVEAEVLEIIDPAGKRVSPECPYFSLCGGCDFQHIETAYQHQLKWEIVRESLSRASISINDSIIRPLLPSPDTFHYRYRIRLKIGRNGQPGFYRAASNELVPVSRCRLATDLLNQALQELFDSEKFKKSAAHFKEIELQHSPADDRIIAILHPRDGSSFLEEQPAALAASLHTINNCLIIREKKLIPIDNQSSIPQLNLHVEGLPGNLSCALSWSPGCFFQVNVPQSINLMSLVLDLYNQSAGPAVLELYCGMGTFSIPLALAGAAVTAIEQNAESIRWAASNARRAGLDHCLFETGSVAGALKNFAGQGVHFDTVLLDPPRQGLGKPVTNLIRMAPGNIIYISCDIATLARDLAALTEGGYRLLQIHPVDMFPQTHHIETVALLEKN